jgi:hypothetical protein
MTDVAKTVSALELLGFTKLDDYFAAHCTVRDEHNGLEPDSVILAVEYHGKQILIGVNQWISPNSIFHTVLFKANKIDKQARHAKVVAVLDDLGIEL